MGYRVPVSSVINPVGPEEPSTYWRRRAVVLVGVLVVVVLVWVVLSNVLGGSEDGSEEPGPEPSFGLSMSPTPEDSATPQESPSGEASPSASASDVAASPSPTGTPACSDGAITVVAATAPSSMPVGGELGLTMTVTNTGSVPCTRDVGAGANEMTISSGSTLAWSSDHCNTSTASGPVVLEPGEEWSTALTWSGTTSAVGCPADQPAAQAGSYTLVVRNASLSSEPAAFQIG